MKPYGAIMSPLEFSQLCQEAVARRADYLVLRFDSKSGVFWSPKSRFRADRAAVVFHLETKDQYVSLEIGPLTDGRSRSLLEGVLPERPMKSVLVHNLVALRAPHIVRRQLLSDSVERQIQDQLDQLILFAPDLVRGDFSVLPDVERLVKARARKYMEEWLGVDRAKALGWDAW